MSPFQKSQTLPLGAARKASTAEAETFSFAERPKRIRRKQGIPIVVDGAYAERKGALF
jgi:hypothetical protein